MSRSPRGSRIPRSKIYVGNLGENRKPDIIRLFQKYGHLYSVYVDENKKFAFVEYQSWDEAQQAIKRCDGREWNGSFLRVEMARRENQPSAANMRGGGYRESDSYTNQLHHSHRHQEHYRSYESDRRRSRSPHRPSPVTRFRERSDDRRSGGYGRHSHKSYVVPPPPSIQANVSQAAIMAAAAYAASDPEYQRRFAVALAASQTGVPLPPIVPSHRQSPTPPPSRHHDDYYHRSPRRSRRYEERCYEYRRSPPIPPPLPRVLRSVRQSPPPPPPPPNINRSHNRRCDERNNRRKRDRRSPSSFSSSVSSSPALNPQELMRAIDAAAAGRRRSNSPRARRDLSAEQLDYDHEEGEIGAGGNYADQIGDNRNDCD